MATLTWHGHSTCSIDTYDGTRLVIKPYLGENPTTELGFQDGEADNILLTNRHNHNFADCNP